MKKIRVKKGEILSIVIMMVITSLVMVTATYAWFTISNTPKVNGLSMTAGTTGSLKIASESSVTPGTPGTYQDTLDFATDYFSTVKLSPVTTADGTSFYSPQYDDAGTSVTGFKPILDATLAKSVAVATFYLKAESDQYQSFDVCLLGGENATFVNGDAPVFSAKDSIRVSFTIVDSNGTKIVIYEPNSDAVLSGSTARATNSSGNTTYGVYTTIAQYTDSKFYSSGTGLTRSTSLCTIKAGEDVKITMRVWIEGMDNDCVSEIAKDKISAAIKFISTNNQ